MGSMTAKVWPAGQGGGGCWIGVAWGTHAGEETILLPRILLANLVDMPTTSVVEQGQSLGRRLPVWVSFAAIPIDVPVCTFGRETLR